MQRFGGIVVQELSQVGMKSAHRILDIVQFPDQDKGQNQPENSQNTAQHYENQGYDTKDSTHGFHETLLVLNICDGPTAGFCQVGPVLSLDIFNCSLFSAINKKKGIG